VYLRVFVGDVVIDNPKQFTNFEQEVCSVDSLFFLMNPLFNS